MNGDVQADRLAQARRPGLAERRGAAQHVEGRLERPFGIVLVGDRRTEQSEHGIAQVFCDKAAIAGDGLAERVEQRALEGPHLLGIEAFGERGESAEVGEDDGDLTAVGVGLRDPRLCRRGRLARRPAARTEGEVRRAGKAAARAGNRLWTAAARAEGEARQDIETAAGAGHRQAHQAVQNGRYHSTGRALDGGP